MTSAPPPYKVFRDRVNHFLKRGDFYNAREAMKDLTDDDAASMERIIANKELAASVGD